MKNKTLFTVLFLLGIVLLMSGCADVETIDNCVVDKPYGFFGGLWHGIVAPIAFFGSLIFDSIAIYAVNNNGGWYDFGFVLGSGIVTFGLGSSKK